MNLLTRTDNENEMATRNTTTAIGVGGGSSRSSTKPASHGSHNIPSHLEPDGERIQPGHTLNALHDDVFSPPRRLDTSASSVTDDDGDDADADTDNRKDSRGHTGPESPKKKKKSAHHLHMPTPHVPHLHVPHFKVGKKHHADAHGGTNGSDLLGMAEHHRDTSSTARIEQTISKESSSASAKADEDRQDAKVVPSTDPDRHVSELSTSQISSHSAQPFGGRPPPPSAEPSSTSFHSSSTNSTGVRPSHPHDHGIYSLLHSPILTKSTKVIGKLAHAPHLPHIPELPHIHLHANRGPSVEESLAALDLEDTSIASILEHMGKHPENVRVLERGCFRLTRLAKEKDNMQEITEAGGIEIILEAIKKCFDDTEVIAQAFSALGNLAALDTANKQKIAHLNGIETIISAMLAHSYDPVLQERACGLLFNLSFDHTNKELIAEHHGLEAIIDAMKHFPAYPNLQHNACCALWNLGGSVVNKERIANTNGVHAIIQTMDHHHSHPHVQRSALGALRTLSMHHGAKEHIAEHGGIASTLNAMRHHHADRHVQREGVGLLRNMLTHHHHREKLRSHRPEQALEHAADNFPLDCEDNAWSCLDRLEVVSERNASSRTHSRHPTAVDADIDSMNGASASSRAA